MNDPCWNIEETDGFDDHYDELFSFRKEMEEKWENNRRDRLEQLAVGLGLTDNMKLVAYLEMLNVRIIELEIKLNELR